MSDERKPCQCTSTERCTGVPLPAGFYCRLRQEESDRYDDFDGQLDDEIDLDEYEAFDCHMDRSGHCGAAGSEDCEFECPYRRDQYARERAEAERKRNKDGRQADMISPTSAKFSEPVDK